MEPTRTREQQHGLADLSSFAHELLEELEVDSWPGAESYREHVNVIDTLACEKDQLVVVGCGNAGKSSFCNQLLGEKLWPVTKCCLGLPLCEACYGSERLFSAGASNTEEFSFYAIEGIASAPEVASDMAGTSSTTEGEGLAPQQQEQEEGPEPLWHVQLPSPLLEPGIVLVDTPGFDGKVECRKAIENYLFSAPRLSEVVVVYLIDANRGISWPDRDFFQLLLQPGCGQVALQMILLLNKCDGRSTCNDEEEDQRMECPRILAEIESELSKYSITQVLPLSLKEARQGVPEALQELAVIEAKIDGALAALKSERIKLGKGQLADLIRKIGDTLEAEHDKHRQLLRVARRLDEATCNRPSWTEMRAEVLQEVQHKLQSEKQRYRHTIERLCFPAEGEKLSHENLQKLEADILRALEAMVRRDLGNVALRYSAAAQEVMASIGEQGDGDAVAVSSLAALPVGVAAILYGSLTAGLELGVLMPIALGAAVPVAAAVYWWRGLGIPTITVDMKLKLFDKVCEHLEHHGLKDVVDQLTDERDQTHEAAILEIQAQCHMMSEAKLADGHSLRNYEEKFRDFVARRPHGS